MLVIVWIIVSLGSAVALSLVMLGMDQLAEKASESVAASRTIRRILLIDLAEVLANRIASINIWQLFAWVVGFILALALIPIVFSAALAYFSGALPEWLSGVPLLIVAVWFLLYVLGILEHPSHRR